MNNSIHRNSSKVRLIGAGTDTPDSGEADPEESSSTKQETIKILDNERASVGKNKKFAILIEILDEQLTELTNILNSDIVHDKAVEILQSTNEKIFKQKKFTSITVAAIIHSIRILNLPITNKEILDKIECCEKQMKKILREFQKTYESPSDYSQIISYMQSILVSLGMNQNFFNICMNVLNVMDKEKIIGGEQDHVIATTVVKISWDLMINDKNLSINCISQLGKCCEYSLKKLLRKVQSNIQLINTVINENQQYQE